MASDWTGRAVATVDVAQAVGFRHAVQKNDERRVTKTVYAVFVGHVQDASTVRARRLLGACSLWRTSSRVNGGKRTARAPTDARWWPHAPVVFGSQLSGAHPPPAPLHGSALVANVHRPP